MNRRLLAYLVAPLVLGSAAAAVLAFAFGWVDAALAAFAVGAVLSAVVAVSGALYAVSLALAILYRAVAVLWRSVQDMGTWLDLGDGDGDGDGDDETVRADAPAGSQVAGDDHVDTPIAWAPRKKR